MVNLKNFVTKILNIGVGGSPGLVVNGVDS